ncbi:Alpha/Beta hydrolase protein [Aspergillus undulatus]|uniref:Alpha/Beta hydrolase protein n=1 Tax=Aspergillus undulatus TaxID=1810928 RepID=UPI003CCDDCE8
MRFSFLLSTLTIICQQGRSNLVLVHALHSLSVNTTSGTAYGLINGSAPDVAQFLGVPYGEAPIGGLRFRPPQRKLPMDGRGIDATKPAGLCPQYHEDRERYPSVYTYDAPWLQPWGKWTEDCLNLNIWAPYSYKLNADSAGDSELLPVIIWIFGGGFYEGGLDTEAMDPAQWVQRSKEHIVVAINARVNIFGFPNSRGLFEENANLNLGLLDQRSAVEWTRDNIPSFGGDPSRMVLWGQSSGAASTDYYNYAYPHDPIVTGYIQHSGSVFATGESRDSAMLNFSTVARNVGCADLSPRDELRCMQVNASAADIVGFWQGYNLRHGQEQLSFTTIVDGITKFGNYTERAVAGNYSKLPAIVGTNYNEMASLIPWPGKAGPNITELRIETQAHQQCPANYNTELRFHTNSTTFRYLNNASFPNISPRPFEGAYHTSELPLLFGTFDQYGFSDMDPTPSPLQYATSAKWQDLYVAFARDPVGALPKSGWPAWAPGPAGKGKVLLWNPKDEQGRTERVARLIDLDEVVEPCYGVTWSIQTPSR